MPTADPTVQTALASSVTALRRVAGYTMPAAFDRRMLDLGERKDCLTQEERDELLAWVEFTQERSAEKLQAELALQRLAAVS